MAETLQERKEKAIKQKEATRTAEHVARKMVTLDKTTGYIHKKYDDAQRRLADLEFNLQEAKHAMEVQQKARDELVEKMRADKERAAKLEDAIHSSEIAFSKVVATMKDYHRGAMLGTGTSEGLKRTTQHLLRQELEQARGYSCAAGTTPGPDAARRLPPGLDRSAFGSRSLPALGR